jgi:hypothetical protein
MSKRFLVFLAVFLAVGVGVFAAVDTPPWQQEPPSSGVGSANPQWGATRGTTFDVFVGPFDAMFSLFTVGAGPTFFDLMSNRVAGGFDNLNLGFATAAAANGPVYAGYYEAGPKPYSLFANLAAGNAVSEPATGTVTNNTATTTVGSTTFRWVTDQTVTNSQVRPFASTNDVVQGLVGLNSSMATGASLGFTMTDSATAAANNTATETFSYDTTPGAKPTPKTDYTLTTVS